MREAAALIGVDEKLVRRWLDPHEGQSVAVADLAALPEDVRVAVVRADLLPGHAIVREPVASADLGCDITHALEVQRASAAALSEQLAAISDGHITADEGARIEARVDEAIAALARVREVARSAQRERVVVARTPLRAVIGGR